MHSLADIGNVSAAVLPRRNQVLRINLDVLDVMFSHVQHISTSRNGAPVLRMYSFSADPTARSGRVSECTLQMCFPRNFMHGSSTATDAVELRYECTIACTQSANVGFFMVRTS